MIKRFLLVIAALVSPTSAPTLAANATPTAGGGGQPNIVESGRNVCWSEPTDLEGLIGSSEVIGQFDLETEIANDFVLSSDATITLARWWGGYFNNNGCGDIHVAPTWNLEFFDDGGCTPVNVLVEYVIPDYAGETLVYCQGGFYPIFRYEGSVSFPATADTRYWFVAQAGDHPFPPQVGRVEAGFITGCPSGFRSIYFSHPDWTFIDDIFMEHDFSQEFECGETPTRHATWGDIKALYR
jgi:hypothetical protein